MVPRRLFGLLLTPLVMALTLVLLGAAPAAAAPGYPVKVIHNYCNGNTVHLKMRIGARGYTNANKLTIASWAQRRVAGRWHTVYNWNRAVYKFKVNGDRHSLTSFRSYHGTKTHKFRIVFKLRAWHNRRSLHTTTYRSVAC